MKNEKMKVVTIKKAYELIGCCRATFHNKHRRKLVEYSIDNSLAVYFKLEDVEAIAKEEREAKEKASARKKIITNFEVVE